MTLPFVVADWYALQPFLRSGCVCKAVGGASLTAAMLSFCKTSAEAGKKFKVYGLSSIVVVTGNECLGVSLLVVVTIVTGATTVPVVVCMLVVGTVSAVLLLLLQAPNSSDNDTVTLAIFLEVKKCSGPFGIVVVYALNRQINYYVNEYFLTLQVLFSN